MSDQEKLTTELAREVVVLVQVIEKLVAPSTEVDAILSYAKKLIEEAKETTK